MSVCVAKIYLDSNTEVINGLMCQTVPSSSFQYLLGSNDLDSLPMYMISEDRDSVCLSVHSELVKNFLVILEVM